MKLFQYLVVATLLLSSIISHAQLTAKFSVENTTLCTPQFVTFTNHSTKGESIVYEWDFGKDAPVQQTMSPDPSVINYLQEGEYTVLLTVTDKSTGEKASYSKTLYAYQKPESFFTGVIDGCTPTTATLTEQATEGGAPIVSYVWSLLGEEKQGKSITTSFTSHGVYQTTLKVTDKNGCYAKYSRKDTVLQKPMVDFDINSSIACAPPYNVYFENNTEASYPVEYNWELEGASYSTAKDAPNLTVNDNSKQSMKLTVSGEHESCVSSELKYIDFSAASVQFEVYRGKNSSGTIIDPANPQPKSFYTFRNITTGSEGTIWKVNGEEITKSSFTDVFVEGGDYEITLVNNPDGECPKERSFTFTIDPTLNNTFLLMNKGVAIEDGMEACNMDQYVSNIYASETTTWKYNGETIEEHNTDLFFCHPGVHEVTMISFYTEGVADTITRTFDVKECREVNLTFIDTSGIHTIDEVICTGSYTVENTVSAYTTTYEYLDEKIDSARFTGKFCMPNNVIKVYREFANGCLDSINQVVQTTKCNTDDFDMYDPKDSLTALTEQDKVCPGQVNVIASGYGQVMDWFVGERSFIGKDTSIVEIYNRKDTINLVSMLPNGCIDTVSKTLQTHFVQADFDLDTTFGCPYPFNIRATDLSVNAEKYYWIIDDEVIDSTSTSLVHSYSKNYQKTEHITDVHGVSHRFGLRVENKQGCSNLKTVQLEKQLPFAKVVSDKYDGCKALETHFTSTEKAVSVENQINQRIWTIDGALVSMATPSSIAQEDELFKTLLADHFGNPAEYYDLLDGAKACPTQDEETRCGDGYPGQVRVAGCNCVANYRSCMIAKLDATFDSKQTDTVAQFLEIFALASKRAYKHTFWEAGEYDVQMVVKDTDGCTDTAKVLIEVGEPLDLSLDIDVSAGAELETGDGIQIVNNSPMAHLVDSWDFSSPTGVESTCSGDPEPELEVSPTDHGELSITATAMYNGCPTTVPDIGALKGIIINKYLIGLPGGGTHKYSGFQLVYSGPFGSLYIRKAKCEDESVDVIFEPTSLAEDWKLLFGDGAEVTEEDRIVPVGYDTTYFRHSYANAGVYDIMLVPFNPQKKVWDTVATVSVTAGDALNAVISLPDIKDGVTCKGMPLKVSTEGSKGMAIDHIEPFMWYVDGVAVRRTRLDEVKLDHFDEGGSHRITLKVFGSQQCWDTTSVVVTTQEPEFELRLNKEQLCGPSDDITVSVEGLPDETTYMWSVGNNNTSGGSQGASNFVYGKATANNAITKTLTASSDTMFHFSAIVTDEYSCVGTEYDSIKMYTINTDISLSDTRICEGDFITISNRTQGADSIVWDFGNGNTANTLKPSAQQFEERGDYDFSAIAYSHKTCQKTIEKSISVQRVDASFSIDKTVMCRDDEITLSLESVPDPATVTWRTNRGEYYSFKAVEGDVGVVRPFYPGIITAYVSVETTNGCEDSQSETITVHGADPKFSDQTICVGDEISVENRVSLSDSYTYDFGNGDVQTVDGNKSVSTTYNERGRFDVTVTATSDVCTDVRVVRNAIHVEQVDATFTVSDTLVCNAYPVSGLDLNNITFTHTNVPDPIVKGSWKFYSSSAAIVDYEDASIKNRYEFPGVEYPSLEVETKNGCKDNSELKITVNGSLGEFTLADTEFCADETIQFSATALKNVHHLEWVFDDGTTSPDAQTEHAYSVRGEYGPSLMLYDSTDCIFRAGQKLIEVFKVEAIFDITNPVICLYDTIAIEDASLQTLNWDWDFGNGDKSAEPLPTTYAYQSHGEYTVNLHASNHIGCWDTMSVDIEVFPLPEPEFVTDLPFLCADAESLTATQLFNDPSIATWEWSSGKNNKVNADGTISYVYQDLYDNDSIIKLDYETDKDTVFDLRLRVKDFRGCVDVFERQVEMFAPRANFTVPDPLGCKGIGVEIINEKVSADSIVWTFGDGTESYQMDDFSKVYTERGDYEITMVALSKLRCRDTNTVAINIQEVEADFSVSDDFICDSNLVEFKHLMTTDPVTGTWDFGTGESAPYVVREDSIQVYTFYETAIDTITLSLETSNECYDTVQKVVKVNGADFVFSSDKICEGDTIIFQNKTSLAETYIWDFGNGRQDTVTGNPEMAVEYLTRGDYSVKLIADHPGCADSLLLKDLVNVQAVDAQFTLTDTVVCSGESITFNQTTVTDPATGTWIFGDGESTVLDSEVSLETTHEYTLPGMLTASLKVSTTNGCTDQVDTLVRVHKADPQMSATEICVGNSVEFTNGNAFATEYIWDFGNGETTTVSTNETLSIEYKERGDYTIQLISYHADCSDTVVITDAINVEAVDASFSTSDNVVCDEEVVSFTLLSAEDPVTGTWDFGDGNTETLNSETAMSVNHSYVDGENYTVSLNIETENGCIDTKTIEELVIKADPVISDNTICKDDQITFINKTGYAQEYIWDFGNGETSTVTANNQIPVDYTERGNFTVKLTVVHPGCTDEVEFVDHISVQHVDASFTTSADVVCNEYPADQSKDNDILFTHTDPLDATSGTWTLESGGTVPYSETVSHVFTELYDHTVKLVVESTNGCIDNAEKVITVNGTEGDFTMTPAKVCKYEDITFTPINLENVETLVWHIGDGTEYETQSQDAIKHAFKTVGTISSYLELFDAEGCQKTVPAKDLEIIEVKALFAIADTLLCNTVEELVITENSEMVDSWSWDFGNGNVSTDVVPTGEVYPIAGTYTVQLAVVNDATACVDTLIQEVVVFPDPVATINTVDTVCLDDTFTLEAETDAKNTVNWLKDDAVFKTNTYSIEDTPDFTAKYSIEVIDSLGCINIVDKVVEVRQYPKWNQTPVDTAIIVGQYAILKLQTEYEAVYEWEVETPIVTQGYDYIEVQPMDDASYSVTVTDKCYSDTYYYNIEVLPHIAMDVPSAFTPNGDGENDRIRVRGWGIKELVSFAVYNRNGQKVFETNDLSNGWDGTFRGQPQPGDTYSYIVKAKTFYDDKEEKKGQFLLVR